MTERQLRDALIKILPYHKTLPLARITPVEPRGLTLELTDGSLFAIAIAKHPDTVQ